MKNKMKKIFTIIFIFFTFWFNNFLVTQAKSDSFIFIEKKAAILYNWIVNYKKNLIKIRDNYDLLEDSVLSKNLKKIDTMLLWLERIKKNKLSLQESDFIIQKIIKSFNLLKKENSLYLKRILNKIDNPEILKKVKKEFDFLAYNSRIISYKLDKLIYKFKKFLDNLKESKQKNILRNHLKNLYIISLKLKNFRKYIYMWNKAPKKTFYSLLKEIKQELLLIKKALN